MGAVPTANGGEIQRGTYHLVKASFFGASPTCAPQFRKLTLKVEAQSNRAGRMEYSLGEAPHDTAPIRDEHVSSTYETTGTSRTRDLSVGGRCSALQLYGFAHLVDLHRAARVLRHVRGSARSGLSAA
jgi:hypothetical protein